MVRQPEQTEGTVGLLGRPTAPRLLSERILSPVYISESGLSWLSRHG